MGKRKIQAKEIVWGCLVFLGLIFMLSPRQPASVGEDFIQFPPETHKNMPPFKIPHNSIPTKLKIVTSETEPQFFLVTSEEGFPYADGDVAQQYVVKSLGLKERCEENPATNVVDVGGRFGDFGLYAAALGCRVTIFEPEPFYYWLIKASVELNGFSERVHLYNYAVSSKESVAVFKSQGGQTYQVDVNPSAALNDPSLFVARTMTLDSIFRGDTIYLLKIDVEGYDPTVLFEGSKETLEEGRIRHVITEYTAWWDSNGKGPWNDFLTRVFDYGSDNSKAYALDRHQPHVYQIDSRHFDLFYMFHIENHLQTDIYIDYWGENKVKSLRKWSTEVYA